jgi:hypothetical protein
LHYMNLALYIKLGMRVEKVYRVLKFHQSKYLKIFVDKCTELRQKSETDFEKELWKKFANSAYGKLIEQVRSYLDCKICVTKDECKKWINSPRFKSMKILSENFVIIFLTRRSITLNKPITSGFTILEHSKRFMYQQYYEVLKPALGDCEVMMSDTDSLLLCVRTPAPGNSTERIKDAVDFSNYHPTHPLYSVEHKAELGYWKDELKGGKISEFCGLRSKTYAFLLSGSEGVNSKCKGVTKAYKKKITFDNYVDCVKGFDQFRITQYQIRAKDHNLYTVRVNKLCFSSFDDKRYLFSCGVHSVPYGSIYINENGGCPMCPVHNPLK